jgi:hypothetical protein
MLRSKRFAGMSMPGLIALAFAFILMGTTMAWSTISTDYTFQYGTGTAVDMTGSASIPTTSDDDGSQTAAPYSIGFPFEFDGTVYNEFSVNSNGLIKLGGTPVVSGTRFNEDFPSFGPPAADMPFLAPFWDDLYLHGDKIRYRLNGVAPNRVLVIEYHAEKYSFNNLEDFRMQVRLYETSNIIEFWYGTLTLQPGANAFNGLIAIAASTSNYGRVIPGAPPQFLTSGSGTVTPPSDVMYTFIPCQRNIAYTGDVAQGGTALMNNRDLLLSGMQVQRGDAVTYQPFAVWMGQYGCADRIYTITISGPAAGDYQVTPAIDTLSSNGTQDIDITFTPQATGVRNATIVVSDDNGRSDTFDLAAEGLTRISYTGNVPQGGTVDMNSGDELMTNIVVRRYSSEDFTPFTITNTNGNASAPGAAITYTLTGTSGGQFSIDPSGESILAGETSTPTITFHPQFRGTIVDTLTVTADGEVRIFPLRAFSVSPEAIFRIGDRFLDSNSELYINEISCVGVQPLTHVITIENPGNEELTIHGVDIFETDTAFGQGAPPYPLRRDQFGNPIPSKDYIVTTTPPVIPSTANSISYPIVVPSEGSTTLYLTFIGYHPGKRFGRAFFRTDATNISTRNAQGVLTEGLLKVDLYGRGVGSRLATDSDGRLASAVHFPQTHIGDSSVAMLTFHNMGVCTLRIWMPMLTIVQGDVEEFRIVKLPGHLIDPATNDLLIPPGMSDTLVLSFWPQQIGSRRAGIRLRTNDSTRGITGITEKGFHYVDLYGIGRADLYASDLEFGQALIGGGPAEHRRGNVTMRNTKPIPMIITQILIEGDDATEFSAGSGWPTLPYILDPGKEVDLGVVFAPAAGGQVGDRDGLIKLITSDGDTVVARLHGVAGTRTVEVNPPAINFAPITLGKVTRRRITITNNSTMPVTLQQPVLSPGSDFTVTSLARLVLVPGQVEYVEVTYSPSTAGASNATLTIPSNSTTGDIQVNLSGTGLKTKFVDADPGSTAIGGNGGSDPLGTPGSQLDNPSVSSVDGALEMHGLALYQSIPNPAREMVEIRYRLAKSGEVELALYDAQGRLVRMLENGHREEGERVVRVNVADLPNGVYHYRLGSNGRTLSRTLTVTR